MTTRVPANMTEADLATQAELDAAVTALNAVDTGLNNRVTTLELPGRVIQTARANLTSVATGTTLIPRDDTIPQITEGDQYLTVSITPRLATSLLRVDFVFNATSSVQAWIQAALFRDAIANALGVGQIFAGSANEGGQVILTVFATAGTTDPTTFRVRAGLNVAGTLTFNGATGARLYGGVYASSITVSEIAA